MCFSVVLLKIHIRLLGDYILLRCHILYTRINTRSHLWLLLQFKRLALRTERCV